MGRCIYLPFLYCNVLQNVKIERSISAPPRNCVLHFVLTKYLTYRVKHIALCIRIHLICDYGDKLLCHCVLAESLLCYILIKHLVKRQKLTVCLLSRIHNMSNCVRFALSADIARTCRFKLRQL